MANRNFPSGGKQYSFHVMPVFVSCNFIVDSANGNGLGLRSLKGPGVASAYMHTSAPLAGSGNPNPEAGIIMVTLADNYNQYISGSSGFVSPLSGSNLSVSGSSLTIGHPYVVTSVGTSTPADFIAIGVPASIANSSQGVQPGLSFVAIATGSGSGSGTVQAPSVSGIASIEVIGDPNQSIAPVNTPGLGASFALQCLNGSGALTAPANGTVVSLTFLMNNSGVPTALGQL